MEKQKTLVIMAAGMGSRFGGLKQLTPIDKNGNFIIDYSIYDAIRTGFSEVVFIIKQEHYDLFRETVGKRAEKQIKTSYAFQNNSNVPAKFNLPEGRKPLGTAHAILCAKDKIKSDFAVINADDFYGYDAFKTASQFLDKNLDPSTYALIGYKAINTIGENGSVKRGICETENGHLKKITESSLWVENGQIMAKELENPDAKTIAIPDQTTVSMNMFGLTKEFLNQLDPHFMTFLHKNKNNLSTCEFYLPMLIDDLVKSKDAKVEVIPTKAKWYGMTYKEDLQKVENSINDMVKAGEYPSDLWNAKNLSKCTKH